MRYYTYGAILASALVVNTLEAFSPSRKIHYGISSNFRKESRPSVVPFARNQGERGPLMSRQESSELSGADLFQDVGKFCSGAMLVASLSLVAIPSASWASADDGGASSMANAKITTGGASTLQSGRTIAITRGVNLDRTDFSNQNLKGVAFQQSIVRDANFQNCNLVGASFFDATVDGSNFENADLSQANFEMAQFNRASLKVRSFA